MARGTENSSRNATFEPAGPLPNGAQSLSSQKAGQESFRSYVSAIPPDGSVTVPLIAPRNVCPSALNTKQSVSNAVSNSLFIFLRPPLNCSSDFRAPYPAPHCEANSFSAGSRHPDRSSQNAFSFSGPNNPPQVGEDYAPCSIKSNANFSLDKLESHNKPI